MTKPATAKKPGKRVAKPARKPKALTTAQRLDAIGIEVICGRIAAGEKQAEIARDIGIGDASLCVWLAADPKRSAHAKEAHAASAKYWDEQAERVLLDLKDESKAGGIAKARELASHYRWRASKYSPKDYGDRLNLDADIKVTELTPSERKAEIEHLAAKLLKK